MPHILSKLILSALSILTVLSGSFYAQSPSEKIDSRSYLEGAIISGIVKEPEYLWVSTYGQGIYRLSLKEEKWINFSTKSRNLENDFFFNIAVSKDYLWAGTTEGLFIYNKKNKKWSKKTFAQGGEFGNWIRALKFDPDKNVLWIGRFRNVTSLDVKKQIYTDYNRIQGNDQKSNNFKSISFDGDSVIWFGTESGVHKLLKKKNPQNAYSWLYIDNKGKNFNNEGDAVSITSILPDYKSVWFGTDEFITEEQPNFNVGGVFKFNRRSNWQKYHKGSGLTANGIYCLERTGNYIWTGVYSFDKNQKEEFGKGLFIINRMNGKVHPVDLNQINISSSTILVLFFDGKNIWIGTDSGLVKVRIENILAKWILKKEVPVIKKK
jgi:ligand-binding sensor domain-containing protein